MNLFITGGAGFIGSNFILMAVANGHRVLNYDALTYAGNLENLRSIKNHPSYHFQQADITDGQRVRRALADGFDGEPFDACINFAAESHVDRSIDAAEVFTRTNVLGTVILLEAARTAGVPMFVQISTDEVYGSLEDSSKKFGLHSPLRPSSPYSASKAAADHLALSFVHTHGYDVRVTRCTNNFGKFQFPEKFIPTIITNALHKRKIPIYGDGLNVRDWIFVEDHCRGIFQVIEKGKAGGIYLFGGSKEVANIDLAKKIATIIAEIKGEQPQEYLSLIEYVKDRPGHDRRYAVDWSSSEAALGWSPAAEFDQELEETVRWYIDHPEWWQPLLYKGNGSR